MLDERVVLELVLVVRAESSTLLAEIPVRGARRRHRERKEGKESRLRRIGDVDEGSVIQRLLAILSNGLGVDDGDPPRRQRQHAVHADEAEKRRGEGELTDELGMSDIGDIEDDEPRFPVGEVSERAFDVGFAGLPMSTIT